VQTIIVVILSYLLGSISAGYIAGRLQGVDLTKVGSGNLGFTNAFRELGPKAGIPVLIFDIGKGAAAVLLASAIAGSNSPIGTTGIQLLAGFAAIAGHIWSIFLRFKGGKAVATTCGVFLALAPLGTMIAFAVWLIVVLTSKYVSVGSLAGAATLPCSIALIAHATSRQQPALVLVAAGVVALVIVIRHTGNIKRLAAGTENRFEFRSGSE
jgi:glycerol-3-phosphate acyltransferase PlsY